MPTGIAPGTRVEIRKRFDRTWARGFEVVSEEDEGYRVRRLSDASILPLVIPPDEVRTERERKKSDMWWY